MRIDIFTKKIQNVVEKLSSIAMFCVAFLLFIRLANIVINLITN